MAYAMSSDPATPQNLKLALGMEVLWDDRHQPTTLLLWLVSCHGNQCENLRIFLPSMEVPWDNRYQPHLIAMVIWLPWQPNGTSITLCLKSY